MASNIGLNLSRFHGRFLKHQINLKYGKRSQVGSGKDHGHCSGVTAKQVQQTVQEAGNISSAKVKGLYAG
jgi:hypothetical protein